MAERAVGEYVDGSRVRITWPCGHSRVETLYVGPKRRTRVGVVRKTAARCGKHQRPMPPEHVRMLARYWRAANGGVDAGPCPKCTR